MDTSNGDVRREVPKKHVPHFEFPWHRIVFMIVFAILLVSTSLRNLFVAAGVLAIGTVLWWAIPGGYVYQVVWNQLANFYARVIRKGSVYKAPLTITSESNLPKMPVHVNYVGLPNGSAVCYYTHEEYVVFFMLLMATGDVNQTLLDDEERSRWDNRVTEIVETAYRCGATRVHFLRTQVPVNHHELAEFVADNVFPAQNDEDDDRLANVEESYELALMRPETMQLIAVELPKSVAWGLLRRPPAEIKAKRKLRGFGKVLHQLEQSAKRIGMEAVLPSPLWLTSTVHNFLDPASASSTYHALKVDRQCMEDDQELDILSTMTVKRGLQPRAIHIKDGAITVDRTTHAFLMLTEFVGETLTPGQLDGAYSLMVDRCWISHCVRVRETSLSVARKIKKQERKWFASRVDDDTDLPDPKALRASAEASNEYEKIVLTNARLTLTGYIIRISVDAQDAEDLDELVEDIAESLQTCQLYFDRIRDHSKLFAALLFSLGYDES